MTDTNSSSRRPRRRLSLLKGARRGLSIGRFGRVASTGIWLGAALLFLVSWAVQPQSVSRSSLLGMLPFAAILAIVAAGQTLVIQQRGIDLSVPGVVSLTVVILTRIPLGDSSKLGIAIALALGVAVVAGLVSGYTVSRIGITPIVTTLGMNALLFGGVMAISGGTPRDTTAALAQFATQRIFGVPMTVLAAILIVGVVAFIVKRTVIGRRFEAVGASPAAARASGLESHRYVIGAFVGANLLYCVGAILLAGVVKTPSAFQGESYLLPSVAAVVLGGTSLLGGIGSVVATAGGALFLTQLEQLVLTTGVNPAAALFLQAGAIAVGVAIQSWRRDRVFDWARSIPVEEAPAPVPASGRPGGKGARVG
jgi:ribose transport system permease protein